MEIVARLSGLINSDVFADRIADIACWAGTVCLQLTGMVAGSGCNWLRPIVIPEIGIELSSNFSYCKNSNISMSKYQYPKFHFANIFFSSYFSYFITRKSIDLPLLTQTAFMFSYQRANKGKH